MAQYGSPASAILGMPCAFDNTIESFIAAADITPGRPVYVTPNAPTVAKAAYAAGDYFGGIAMISHKGYTDAVGLYKSGDNVNVLTRGRIWCQAGAAFSAAPAVAFLTAATGKFTPVDGGAGELTVGTIARSNQTSVDGLVEIEVNGTVLAS